MRWWRAAFSGFLHHTLAVVLGADKQNNAGLRRVWWYACREENVNPAKPLRLPLLFAIDSKPGIAGTRLGRAKSALVRRQTSAFK